MPDPPLSVLQGETFVQQSTKAKALEEGGLRLGESGQVSVADNLNVLLENPAESGVELTVFALVLFVDADSRTFPTFHKNPTTDLPTTTRTIMDPNLGTEAPTAAVIYADDMTTTMSGSDETFRFGSQPGRTEMPIFFKLPPGTSIGFTNTLGSLSSADVSVTAWFIEEAI